MCAFVWAGTHGVDVTNNSYFADPFYFNCPNDKDARFRDQERAILLAEGRAIRFAQRHGVGIVAAEGNFSDDLANPTQDRQSPTTRRPCSDPWIVHAWSFPFGNRHDEREGDEEGHSRLRRLIDLSADPLPCPSAAVLATYAPFPSVNNDAPQTCVGPANNNSWYGHGLINARKAVTAANETTEIM